MQDHPATSIYAVKVCFDLLRADFQETLWGEAVSSTEAPEPSNKSLIFIHFFANVKE
jgi:hypothetical protein